jgi:predicted AAA+ superfamily ATPase
MRPFDALEAVEADSEQLWIKGGFPESFLAASDQLSQRWRRDFIRTYLEQDIPMLGPRIPAETLRRFWTMLAHHQSGLLNASEFARSLGVDSKTVASYLDLLVDLLLVRRLEPGMAMASNGSSNRRASMCVTAALCIRCLALRAGTMCWAIR